MMDTHSRAKLSPADWARLSGWFDAALALPLDAREAWLAARELEAPPLGAWLRHMLQAHAARSPDDWLEQGPSAAVAAVQGLEVGARVGPWQLLALLGSGGQATVWRASRVDALPAREIALKLPLLHRAGSNLAERFAREREILARLNHPNIAPLYAAGVAPDGTPWLAMELVHGQPLGPWCDARRLDLPARVALFHQVIDAVVYAHGQLVIHRDLKPSNILVDDDGRVRLLDFGIAKLLDAAGQTQVDLTQLVRPLTPGYAAPEQLRGEPLSAATDVYALGVLLFELLTGARPYRLSLDTPAQLEQAIVDGELRRASDCVTPEAAELRASPAGRLARLLRGDLDTILAKALRREPGQRYASAAELADDLRRWADHVPVRARPTSRRYRLARFVRRYRATVVAGGVVLASLVGALVVSLVQVRRADAERDLALAQRGQGMALRSFLLDQIVVLGREGRVPELGALLARTEANARAAFATEPDELAQALFVIGGQRRSFEGARQALPGLTEALRTARDPHLRAEISCDHAAALYGLGQHEAAMAQVRRAGSDTRLLAGSRSLCLDYLVLLELAEGDLPAALRAQTLAVALAQHAPDATGRARQRGRMMLAYLQAMTGEAGDPDPVFQQMLDGLVAAGRQQSLTAIELRTRWATLRLAAGDAAGALGLIEQNLLGAAPQSLPNYLRLQGLALAGLGRSDEALAVWARGEALASAAGDTRWAAAMACLQAGARHDAPALVPALARLPASLPAHDEARLLCALAGAELAQARAPAEALLTPLLSDARLPPHWRVSALLRRGEAALREGDAAAARVDAESGLALAARLQGGRAASFRAAALMALREAATRGGRGDRS